MNLNAATEGGLYEIALKNRTANFRLARISFGRVYCRTAREAPGGFEFLDILRRQRPIDPERRDSSPRSEKARMISAWR
jgi:hypothetical protein